HWRGRTPLRRRAATEPADHRRAGRLARHPHQLPRAPLTAIGSATDRGQSYFPPATRAAPADRPLAGVSSSCGRAARWRQQPLQTSRSLAYVTAHRLPRAEISLTRRRDRELRAV